MTWPDIKHQPTPRTANNTNIVTTSRNYNNTDTVSSEARRGGNILRQSYVFAASQPEPEQF